MNILILAPHTDDGEFGCGATIARFVEKGSRVIYVAFSAAEQSLEKHLPRDTLRKEVLRATHQLGIKKDDCITLNFEVRNFPEHRQEILEKMIELNQRFNPSIVFLPSTSDTHQDHNVISSEGFRAFKKTTMLGYEMPWNNLQFVTSCFYEISKENLDKKIKALDEYHSQKHRSYASAEFVESLAKIRGVQCGCNLAETFEVIRWINKVD